MDGNKDESERCIAIAQRFINEGKRDVAVKYLHKAERLFPSQRAKELMDLLNKLNGTTSMGSSPKTQQPTENGDAAQHEKCHSSEANHTPGSSETKESKHDYTPEQLEAVKRVKKCKDYYEILGVTKEATDNDFKKQYKKLALQFHPDKNKAPGATEAFKAIGNAFAVLSDKDKRLRYDTCGANEDQHVTHRSRRGNSYYEYDYTRGCEADMTAEELFNMFFGGRFSSEDVYMRRGTRSARGETRNSEHREQNNYNAILQMLPILILIVLSLTSSLFQSDPPYSLIESSKYPIPRQTQNLHIVYYVKENFLAENKNVRRVEQQVEEEYVANLRTACFREMNYKETMVWRARQFGDEAQMKKANGMKTPSCEALMKMRS